jgi:hypothetical protein
MPVDPEIGAREIPLRDRTVAFTRDTALLMREAKGGPPTVARVIYAALVLIVATWIALLAFAAAKNRPERRRRPTPELAGQPLRRKATARSELPSA